MRPANAEPTQTSRTNSLQAGFREGLALLRKESGKAKRSAEDPRRCHNRVRSNLGVSQEGFESPQLVEDDIGRDPTSLRDRAREMHQDAISRRSKASGHPAHWPPHRIAGKADGGPEWCVRQPLPTGAARRLHRDCWRRCRCRDYRFHNFSPKSRAARMPLATSLTWM